MTGFVITITIIIAIALLLLPLIIIIIIIIVVVIVIIYCQKDSLESCTFFCCCVSISFYVSISLNS